MIGDALAYLGANPVTSFVGGIVVILAVNGAVALKRSVREWLYGRGL